jgi:hypothetical protein
MRSFMNEQMTTRFSTEADLEASKIKRLAALINEVYDDAESGMWKRPGRAPLLARWSVSSETRR